jgi:hypothetical protein
MVLPLVCRSWYRLCGENRFDPNREAALVTCSDLALAVMETISPAIAKMLRDMEPLMRAIQWPDGSPPTDRTFTLVAPTNPFAARCVEWRAFIWPDIQLRCYAREWRLYGLNGALWGYSESGDPCDGKYGLPSMLSTLMANSGANANAKDMIAANVRIAADMCRYVFANENTMCDAYSKFTKSLKHKPNHRDSKDRCGMLPGVRVVALGAYCGVVYWPPLGWRIVLRT